MSYTFPDEETLVRYLCLLSKVLTFARHRAYQTDKKLAEMLDAVHNIPDLLARWQDMKEEWVLGDLEAYEAKYCGDGSPLSGILKNGVEPHWQLRWQTDKEGKEKEANSSPT